MDDILSTIFWSINPAFFERVMPIVVKRIEKGQPFEKVFDLGIGKKKAIYQAYHDMDDDEFEDEDDEMENIYEGVQIIEVHGTMTPRGDWSAKGNKDIIQELELANQNEDVKAVVFDVDSHGGSIAGIQELYNAIYNFEKPTVTIANNNMHSAAYHAFCASDYIYSNTESNSFVGSIGVYMLHCDWSKAEKEFGVKYTYIAGEKAIHKVVGNPHNPLSENDFKILQAQCTEIHEAFIQDVLDARGEELSEDLFTGLSYSGIAAVENGLVDDIGTLETAVLKAKNLAKARILNLI